MAPWTFSDEPPAGGAGNVVTLVEGSTFCISQIVGDIMADRAQGLFVRDTRVVSTWALSVDGRPPKPLAVQRGDPFTATCLSRVPPAPGLADSTLLVVRRRYVGNGMREDIAVRNTGRHPARCTVRLRVAGDFADLFEVKDGRVQGQALDDVAVTVDDGVLQFSRTRGSLEQSLIVRADGTSAVEPKGLCWDVEIPGGGEWTTTVEAIPAINGRELQLRHPRGAPVERAAPAVRLHEWRSRSPQVRTSEPNLAAALAHSVEDLGALRIFDPAHPERAAVAAGAPWFMAVFGRDSLLTAWMLMPLDASLAVGTLHTLADHQGVATNPATEEEPGRILHEIRFGPATDFALGGHSVYYGTADATPLFVMLLGELGRWGGNSATVQALLPHADRALDWIADYGDLDGDGFVEYHRKTEKGLVNQGWKDSWDGINFADGDVATSPIALAEVQGYVYAAYRARGYLARDVGDEAGARHWAQRADEFKVAFNDAFWLPDKGWFAVGLDGNKRPIDALTSNIGHCLWTGIVDDDKAQRVADHLLSDDMFTGWGIRTLARSMGAYNPLSYHNGSVWPHDNAICVSGLMRYGYVQHAQRVIAGILAAAEHFDHRLPELFCGFDRSDFREPVPYPSSCSPQAWAAAAPLLFLRSLLRFDPRLPDKQVHLGPEIPQEYLPLKVSGVRLGGHSVAIEVQSPGSWRATGLERTGISIVEPLIPKVGSRT